MTRSLLLLLGLAACTDGSRGNPACGIAALAAPTSVLAAFGRPQQTLSEPPRRLPERTVARMVAGPSYRAILGRADTGLVVGIEGRIPEGIQPTYGVLVVERGGATQGVLVYEGLIVEAAPQIGVVSIGALTIPLIGVELELATVQDAACPLFPDSLRE
jgi:hypothetical protein